MPFSLIPQMVLPGYGSLTPGMLRERGVRLLLCCTGDCLLRRCGPQHHQHQGAWRGMQGLP